LCLAIACIFIALNYISIVFHQSQDKKVFETLYKNLNNVEQKEKAFAEFIKYGKKSGDYLSKKLTTEKDNIIKTDVMQIIGIIGCTNCENGLVVFLNDPNWRMRFFTIDSLDKLTYKNISSFLPNIIRNDSNTNVKIKAIITLGKYGNTKDIIFLENLLDQKEYKGNKLSKAINIALVDLKSHNN